MLELEQPKALWRRWPAAVLAALAGLAVGYGLDLLTSADIPRDVVVAGVDIGGLDRTEAERLLRTELDPRLRRPVRVVADGAATTLDARTARIAVDWDETIDRAATLSYDPWHRLKAVFVDRPVDLVASGDEQAIGDRLDSLAKQVGKPAREGAIRFVGAKPSAVLPVVGRRLDVARASRAVVRRWAERRTIVVPVDRVQVRATPDGVRKTLHEFAEPAVAAPVTLHANGATATLTPTGIASVLTFVAARDGTLTPRVDVKRLREAVGKRLEKGETKSKNARIKFGKKSATVVPSTDGRELDWDAAAKRLVDVLRRRDGRILELPFRDTTPELTTGELKDLGVTEVIGKFSTGGFAPDSGINIRTIAKKVNGAIVWPGETFGLNGFTGPRGTEQGYVDAGVIKEGVPARAVGGGISQFATTLYNAAYFAAMDDVEHKEHSYYISRYPLAREATVFQNPDGSSVIDLKFRNTSDTGVAIQTIWTPSGITVRIWGTKKYQVKSKTSEPYGYTSASVITKPYGAPCVPQGGAAGYRADNTRIISDRSGKVVKREKRTVVYSPQPVVQCAPPPPKPKPSKKPRPSGSAGVP